MIKLFTSKGKEHVLSGILSSRENPKLMGHTVELTSIHLQIVYKFYVKYVFALCVYIATWDI